ncbi:MAG: VWA domain-containing protein [Acidobacteria bacterium]|nr:VWA domain-containing protein [Acidobacteriota bacterium]
MPASFGEPAFLRLLALPAALVLVWLWRFARRLVDQRRLARARTLPLRERFAPLGDLPFWLAVLAAASLLFVALARPRGPSIIVHQGGLDLIILQDGSASMRVQDVAGDRWQRAMQFVRTLGNSLSWKDDRIALALFARSSAPQVRLTKDPNTFFFFLDHLSKEPPFRLEDDNTWDTNLELGIYWGLRLITRDEEFNGKSPNPKLFVLLSDGEVWSGQVARSLKRANDMNVPLYVVGVGTVGGGLMPIAPVTDDKAPVDPDAVVTSRLDRQGLQRVAAAGNGQYFELDRDSDRNIASAIVESARRLAPDSAKVEKAEELYWNALWCAGCVLLAGLLFLRDRGDLWLQLVGAVAIMAVTIRLLG